MKPSGWLFAGIVAASLPFFPARWPVGIAGAAALLTLVSERAGLAFCLAVPILPLGNYDPIAPASIPDASADLVTCYIGLHHAEPRTLAPFIASLARVLRPGGHFIAWIAEFAGAPPYDPYATRMARPYDDEHLFHIDRTWFLPLMAQTGFRAVEILHLELPFHQLFMSFEKPAHGM